MKIRRALTVLVAVLALVAGWPPAVGAAVIEGGLRTLNVSGVPPLTAPHPPNGPAGCAPVALFAVPGSGETSEQADPGEARGLLRAFTVPAAERLGGRLHVEYLPYPATLDRPPYPVSELRGVETLDRVTGAYATRCPRARLVLLGYSQGADVVSDLVHRAQRGTVAVTPDALAGAVMLGSPRRDPDGPNVVAAPGRGVLGPRPTRELAVYDGRVREVCAPTDPICASVRFSLGALRDGLDSGAHRSYPRLPVGEAGEPLAAVFDRALGDLVAGSEGEAVAAGAPVAEPR